MMRSNVHISPLLFRAYLAPRRSSGTRRLSDLPDPFGLIGPHQAQRSSGAPALICAPALIWRSGAYLALRRLSGALALWRSGAVVCAPQSNPALWRSSEPQALSGKLQRFSGAPALIYRSSAAINALHARVHRTTTFCPTHVSQFESCKFFSLHLFSFRLPGPPPGARASLQIFAHGKYANPRSLSCFLQVEHLFKHHVFEHSLHTEAVSIQAKLL